MSHIVKVQKYIDFREGEARHGANIKGPPQIDGLYLFDDFTDSTLSTVKWAATHAGAGDNIAYNAAVGGQILITTSTTDNATLMLSSGINWEDDKYCMTEAYLRINDVDQCNIFFGFSDATSETTPAMALDYGGAGDIFDSTATNAVGFVCDPDQTLGASIMCCGVATNVDETPVDSGIDWTDAVWHVLRVELNPDGEAFFYIDGNPVGFLDAAVTSGTDLCVSLQAGTCNSGSAETIDVDYIWAWQER